MPFDLDAAHIVEIGGRRIRDIETTGLTLPLDAKDGWRSFARRGAVAATPGGFAREDAVMALKVIGAGLGRTGTLSLKVALEKLGYGPCYHMTEVLMHPDTAPGLWMQAADGHADWDAIFRGYAATVDFPACTFWRELSRHYPDAKVLLSVRDPVSWFESTQASIFGEHMLGILSQTPMKPFLDKTVMGQFGDRIHDRDFMVEAFRRHSAEVERTIPADRLLVYNVAEGWGPLCAFLGVPVPAEPFPRVNSREEMAEMVARRGPITSAEDLQAMVKARLESL